MPRHLGAGDLPVDVQVADVELDARALDVRGAPRVDAAGERVRRAVGNGERLVDVVRPQNDQHGAEDLLLGEGVIGRDAADDDGSDEESALRPARELPLEEDEPVTSRELDVAVDTRDGFGIDERPDGRRRVVRGTRDQRLRRRGEPLDERLVGAPDDDDAAARGALLPRISEGGTEDAGDRLVEIGVVVHDDRVLAAHLRHHALDSRDPRGRFRCLPRDEAAHLARTGEGDGRNVGVRDETCADDLALAGQKMDGALRHARIAEDAEHVIPARGRLLGRLQDDGVAQDERRGRHSHEDRDGEIPGTDDDGRPARREHGRVALPGHVVALGLGEGPREERVVAAEIDGLRDVRVGVAPRLAGLEARPGRELVAPRRHQLRGLLEDRGAVFHRYRAPAGEPLLRRAHGQVGVLFRRGSARSDDSLRIRRRDAEDALRGFHLAAADHDRTVDPGVRLHPFEGRLERLAHALAREVAERLVLERIDGLGRGSLVHHGTLLDVKFCCIAGGLPCGRRGPRDGELDGPLVRLLAAHEGFVARVLEQAPHQVSHAGDELAERRVHAHALVELRQRDLQRVGHPVERLELDVPLGELRRSRRGETPREAPRVVARERWSKEPRAVHQQIDRALVASVGLPLLLVDRARPAALAGEHSLVVPVRTLHETDPHRRPPAARPRCQALDVALCVLQVRLDDDPDVGALRVLRAPEHVLEERERQLLPLVLLHIDVHEAAHLAGRVEDAAEARHDRARHAVGVEGIEQRGERGKLHGDVHPRQRRSVVIAIDQRLLREATDSASGLAQQHDVLVGIGVRLAIRQHGFTERVQGHREPSTAHAADRRDDLTDGRPRDELPRHPEHVPTGSARDDLTERPARRRQLDTEAQRRGQLRAGAAQVLEKMSRNVAGRQTREHVDEAEELHLELRVLHEKVEEPLVEPRGVRDPWVILARVLDQRARQLQSGNFDASPGRHDRSV